MEPLCNGTLEDELQEEVLGSVTHLQESENGDKGAGIQLRTSARVSKKLKLDSQAAAAASVSSLSQSAAAKKAELEEKPATVSTPEGKPKGRRAHETSVWSPDDKNAFFESLNEYGKDFDAIHHHIELKAKKRGEQEPKSRDQVRHFYYRTWHKISKHLRFPEGIKKATQELYGLINFGELRKKIGFVTEKNSYKLNEMIYLGSTQIRIKGKTWRIKTPICKALRKLNALEDCTEEIKLPSRVVIELRPRNNETWARVQSLSHNPRVCTELSLHRRLVTLISYLQGRWRTRDDKHRAEVLTAIAATSTPPATSAATAVTSVAAPLLPQPSPSIPKVDPSPLPPQPSSASMPSLLSAPSLPLLSSEESTVTSTLPSATTVVKIPSTLTGSISSCTDATLPDTSLSPSLPPSVSSVSSSSSSMSSPSTVSSSSPPPTQSSSAYEFSSSSTKSLLSTSTAVNTPAAIGVATMETASSAASSSPHPFSSLPLEEVEPDGHPHDDGGWELCVAPQIGAQMVEASFKLSAIITSAKLSLLSNASRQGKDYSYMLSELQAANKQSRMRVTSVKRQRTDSSSEKNSPAAAAATPPKHPAEDSGEHGPAAAAAAGVNGADNQPAEAPNADAQPLMLQCDPVPIENAMPVSSSLSPGFSGECVSPSKDDFEPDSLTETKEKTADVLQKMKSGWTLRNSGTTRIGELYVMFGSNSKLVLDYWWERTRVVEDEPHTPADSKKNNLAYHTMNDAIGRASAPVSDAFVSSALQKLVSLAKLSYRKAKVECPCGHVCYSNSVNSALKNAPRNRAPLKLQWPLDDSEKAASGASKSNNVDRSRVTGTIVSTVASSSTTLVPTTSVSGASQPIVCQQLAMDGVFRRPLLTPFQPKSSSRMEADFNFKAQLDKFRLSRYCNRRGRVRTKNVVVPRMLPLLPKMSQSNLMLKVVRPAEAGGFKRIAPAMPKSSPAATLFAPNSVAAAAPCDEERRAAAVAAKDYLSSVPLQQQQQQQQRQEVERRTFFDDSDAKGLEVQSVIVPAQSQVNLLDLSVLTVGDLTMPDCSAGQSPMMVAPTSSAQMFGGLLSGGEDVTILQASDISEEPPTSPTSLLKEDVLINTDDYSLSSLLGHLESPEKGSSVCDERSNSCDDSRLPDVDAQLHSLMCEDSIDYMGKFADLAAQITAESNGNK